MSAAAVECNFHCGLRINEYAQQASESNLRVWAVWATATMITLTSLDIYITSTFFFAFQKYVSNVITLPIITAIVCSNIDLIWAI